MKKTLVLLSLLFILVSAQSQKKPLDHSVYNGWQSIGEKMISNDGKWVVYTVDLQEGDNQLVVQSADATYRKEIPRGYNALITEDSRFVICRIKPPFSDTRDAKIKKKKQEEFPKDSLAILELGGSEVWKKPRIKDYRTPQKNSGWAAYLSEKQIDKKNDSLGLKSAQRMNDSLVRIIDSLRALVREGQAVRKSRNKDDGISADNENSSLPAAETGTDLTVRNLLNGAEKTYRNVLEYYFSKNGLKLLIRTSRDPKDSLSNTLVLLLDLSAGRMDTLSRGINDFRNFAMTDDGSRIAWVAERDAKPKDLQKFYKLWFYEAGMDSAALLADRFSAGMKLGMTVSENGSLNFSKSGQRLFFGTAPILAPKDTSLIDIDLVKVDIWHYQDDYLQTVQLNHLQEDLKQAFLAVYDFNNNSIQQLADKEMPQVIQTNEGDGDLFIGLTDFGKRIESQWQGFTRKDIYAVDTRTAARKLLKKDVYGTVYPSSTGRYIVWYDRQAKNYFAWDGSETRNISRNIKLPLYDEENDVPDAPSPYGVMAWQEGDSALYLYDRYDVWKVSLDEKIKPVMITGMAGKNGRKSKNSFRYLKTDMEERFIRTGQPLYFRTINDESKQSSILAFQPSSSEATVISGEPGYSYNLFLKAKNAPVYLYSKENFKNSPDLFVTGANGTGSREDGHNDGLAAVKLSSLNPQQQNYNWGTVELFRWKAYNGRQATGLLYKPEDFNPKKKYPMICYFYEKLSDNLNNYIAPAPIRSAINISFFVSRGYILFIPDIEYKIGHPGKSAYDYIVSGARALVKKGFVDSSRMALQGHSWGGYQTAQVVTMTRLFKAAWAGAPVANMTSAYGGIRWESGMNRQFQYEKSQSRIGATLWQQPQLYIENSPLFHLKNVNTPLVIMHNDNDGAVPWYQGIELFTALRRLGKKVWMFNYNGEGHGLSDRKNKLDYQIRMQQFFDWILKGEKPAAWIMEGVPAVRKGKDWGLSIE